jgi:hypothetical protein
MILDILLLKLQLTWESENFNNYALIAQCCSRPHTPVRPDLFLYVIKFERLILCQTAVAQPTTERDSSLRWFITILS